MVAPEIPSMKYLEVAHIDNTGLIQSLVVNMQYCLGASIHSWGKQESMLRGRHF